MARLVAELVEVLGQVVAGDLVVLAALQLHQPTGCCVAEGFELGAILGFLVPLYPAVAVPQSPAVAVPSSPAVAVPLYPAVAVPQSPAVAVPSSPAVAVP